MQLVSSIYGTHIFAHVHFFRVKWIRKRILKYSTTQSNTERSVPFYKQAENLYYNINIVYDTLACFGGQSRRLAPPKTISLMIFIYSFKHFFSVNVFFFYWS